jgi:hypothetical protein
MAELSAASLRAGQVRLLIDEETDLKGEKL